MSTTERPSPPSPLAYPATPTGILLGTFQPGTPEWDAARGGLCITATEIAAVMGLSPWQSRFSLWHKKAGLPSPPFEPSPAMEWGTRLEPAVAGKFIDEHPEWISGTAGTFQHHERTWQRATPDQLLYPCAAASDREGATDIAGEPTALLEVKTSPFGDDWDNGVPAHYRAQILWQLDTLGLTTCHVALLVSGHDYREYVVDYDATDAELMRKAAREFLDDVANDVRPPIDTSDVTYQTVRRQAEGRDDVDVEIPAAMAVRYEDAQDAIKAAEAELTGAKSEVLDAIGNGYRAVVGERRIAYRTVKPDGTTKALQPYTRKKAIAA
jgi:putative phage-type endonuclease